MRIPLILLMLTICAGISAQQFSFDNNTYKTVYPEDLCKTLKENPGYSLLDVRSYGEHYDTSSSKDFNLGYFKNSLHIPVNELAKRWRELDILKDQPLFIYCSHSQRSRRASKMLADSGFTRIYNINGGMTNILLKKQDLDKCFEDLYETKTAYKLISPAYIAEQSKKSNPWFIIDVRQDSVFKGISTYEKRNTLGHFQSAVNIPINQLESNLTKIPKDQPLLIVDEYGSDSPAAAEMLIAKGFKNVSVLFNGMNAWLEYSLDHKSTRTDGWESHTPYKIINVSAFDELMKKNPNAVLIDLRKSDQYKNQSKNYWENIGRIKNAINIPFDEFEKKTSELPASKNQSVILYIFSNQNEVYEIAKKMHEMGYKNVNVLFGGIWNIRWTAYNIKGKSFLKDWVIDIPQENM